MVNSWNRWCRLCANEGPSNIEISVFLSDSNFLEALHNLFAISISGDDNWGNLMCLKCHKTMMEFLEFRHKVSKVQKMYEEIRNKSGKLDVKQIKSQYKLDEVPDEPSIVIHPAVTTYEPEINPLQNDGEAAYDIFEESTVKKEPDENSSEKPETIPEWSEFVALDTIEFKSEPITSESAKKTAGSEPSNSEESNIEKPNDKAAARCPICNNSIVCPKNLYRHLRTQHGVNTKAIPAFICEECGKSCKTLGRFEEHMKTHVKERVFKCLQCDKCFKTKRRLKLHEDTHSSTSYVCTVCGTQLNSKKTLNMHMVVHSDEKSYKCDYCGNAYKRAKALKVHLILHTGLKPYACDFCDRTFANGSNCRSHKKKSHPVELAAQEAAGKLSYTKVPELKELRASLPIPNENRIEYECDL